MGSLTDLRTQAISAAKNTDWQTAVAANQEIIEINPADIAAYNRLGMSFLQLGNPKQATIAFKEVLKIDATNPIAKKQLERISRKEEIAPPQFTRTQFIEEPGKSKICTLHRLAGRNVLEVLRSGQACQLKPKSRYISVETTDGHYIGALPDDISYRLSNLIASGNLYECVVYTVSKTDCSVFVREKYRNLDNQHHNSFPLNGVHGNGDDVDDALLLMDSDGSGGVNNTEDADSTDMEEAEADFEQESFTSEDIARMQ